MRVMKKRITSFLLMLVMVLNMLPMNVLAEEADLGQVRVIVENTTYSVAEGAPWDGTLVDTQVALTQDMTMMSAIAAALDTAGYGAEGVDSGYISSINDLAEFDGGNGAGWMGTLNDWFTNMGFDSYTVAEGTLVSGDVIRVMYTCDMGADIGGGRDTIDDTSLTALTVSSGTMDPGFAADTLNYTVSVAADVSAVTVNAVAANKENQVYLSVGETAYRRTASVPVEDGTVIHVRCGEEGSCTTYDLTIDKEIVNNAPVLSGEAEGSAAITAGENYSINLGSIFTDADSDTLTYSVSVNGGEAVAVEAAYSYTPAAAGVYTLVFTANDGKADSPSYTVTLTVEEPAPVNNAPTLVGEASAAANVTLGESYTVNLGEIFTDADGDELTYSVTVSSGDAATTGPAEENYSYTPESVGEYLLGFIANDGQADSPSYNVTLTAEEAKAVTPKFAAFDLYTSSGVYNNGGEPLTMTPAFESDVYEGYSVVAPDYLSSLYAVCVFDEETIQSGNNYSVMVSNSWSGWTGASVKDYTVKASAYYPQGYVNIYFRDTTKLTDYKVTVNKYGTLSSLTVDGVMDTAFNRDTESYHAYVDSTNEGVAITATAYKSNATITINGTTVTSGSAYTLPYEWESDDTMTVEIVVSGTDLVANTYTVELEKMPRAEAPYIMTQPVGADYIQGNAAKALNVVASAGGTMNYQWYGNTTDANEGGTAIDGAISAEYTPSTENVGTTYYYCVITNTGAETGNTSVTETACIVVDPDPTPVAVITNPGSEMPDDYEYAWDTGYVYKVGDAAEALTVTATSAAEGGEFSYQWNRISRPYNVNGWSGLSGDSKNASYVPATTEQMANSTGSYYGCRVTYTFKGKSYTSWATTGETYTDESAGKTYDVCGVYVFVKTDEAAVPVITKQPVGAEYVVGDTATALSVSCTVTDGGTRTYQWYTNSVNSTEGATAIEGATSSSYALGTVNEGGTNYYFCVITNTNQGKTAAVTSDIAEIKVVTVAEKVGDKLNGSGTETDPYILADADDFQALADLVAEGVTFAGMHFEVTADVSLPASWTSIGALKSGTTSTSSGRNMLPFSGVLDGNEHTITFAYGSMPLFKYVREATVMNLNISGEYIADDGLVSDYVVDYGSDGSYSSGTGGSYASGCPDTIDIINVTIKSGTAIKGSGLIGGYASGGNIITISDCTVEPGVKIGWDAEAGASAGANKIGSLGGDYNGTITNSTSAATVYGAGYVGGIVGSKGQSMGPYSVTDCVFTGEIIATGNYVGGIAGGGYSSASAPNSPCADIQNCYVTGNITGGNYVGGIFGGEAAIAQCWENGAGQIRNNHFCGTVTATAEGGIKGGIIGYMQSLNVYNEITNNYFLEGCGAVKGIGTAKYVDTSCAETTAVDGVIYVDSSKGKPDYTGFSKTNHNRTDDPLGADADTLAKAMTAEAFADGTLVDLLNAGAGLSKTWYRGERCPVFEEDAIAASTVDVTFYGHSAQLNSFEVYTYEEVNGEEVIGTTNLLAGVEDSDTSNTQTYATALEPGDYWVKGFDGSGVCSGAIKITVTADGSNEFTILRAYQLKASNSGWVLGTDYTLSALVTAPDMAERIVEMGTAADYSGNQLPSVLCLYGDTVKVTYTPSEARLAENYIETFKSAVLTANSSSFSVTIPQGVPVTFNVPAGAEVDAGRFHTYYVYDFATADSVVTNDDGTVSYTYLIPKSTDWFYRVQHEDGVTYWNFGRWTAATTVTITAADLYIGSEEFTSDTIYRYDKNVYDRADIYLNINGRGYMDMAVGERYELNVFRNWMAIESYMNNKVALPDMTYKVIDENGKPSDILTITPDANNSSVAAMTANGTGTAIVLVTYDAMTHMAGQSSTSSKQFSAIWPECTGVFVVTVGAGETSIDTGMLMERYDAADTAIDAEHDILFYLGDAGAEYTFKPESGTTVTVARSTLTTDSLTYNGFTNSGVTVAEDGTVTVSGLTSGRHIIKVEKDGAAAYQVVTARGVSYAIQDADGNALTPKQIAEISAGDTIYLQYSNLVNPAEKLSGAYNFNASILYFGEDETSFRSVPGSNFGVYDFSGNPVRQKIAITIPKYWEGNTYTLNGAIKMGGFGNVSVGGHRGITYRTGLNGNYNADTVGMTLSAMPSVTFELAETEFLTGTLSFKDENGHTINTADLTVTLTDTSGNDVVMKEDGTFKCVAEEYSYIVNGAGYMYTTGSVTITEEGANSFVITLRTSSEGAWDGVAATEPAANENGVYQISNGAEFAWFAAVVNSGNGAVNGVLTADIDLADYPWTPIGSNSAAKRFTGTLDGAGHIINNLNVNVTTSNSGLFGYIYQGAAIKNLTVNGNVTSTNTYAAGLTGYSYGSAAVPVTIENVICNVDVTVTGKKNYVGGIAGYANGTNFINCANQGDVTSDGNYVAGIASYGLSGVNITGCYNAGNITGAGYVGGIAGYNGTAVTNITACYNTGTITGTSSYVGGISAWLKGSSDVSDVYNVGTVTGSGNTESLFGILQTATLTRGYSLEGTTDTYGEALTADEMKSAELDVDYFAGTCDSYPALLWQTDVNFHSTESAGIVTAPTCTEKGYTAYVCDNCEKEYISDYVEVLGHEWCEDETGCDDCVYTAPDCDDDGSSARTCRRENCDEVHTDVIPATGHTEDTAQTVDHVYYKDCICVICDESYVVWDDERLNYMDLPSVGLSAIALTDNTYPWSWNTETERFESGNKGVNSSTAQTSLEVTLTESAEISFNYGVSSEARYDKMTITALIGGETLTIANAISGTSESTFTYELPAGTYTLTFAYSKDSSSASGSDIGWFSNVVIDVDEEQIAADGVIALIEAIGEVTLDSEEAIEAARAAYDALTEEQKALVTNYETLTAAEAALEEMKAASEITVGDMYTATGNFLKAYAEENGIKVDSIGGEWLIFGLARADKNISDEILADYLEAVETYITGKIQPNGRLHNVKSTENARIALALTALGYDAADFEGYDLISALQDTTWVTAQGNNAAAYALLTFNAADFEASNKEALIDSLLNNQLDNGGWSITGSAADLDTTAMVVQSLAPYYDSDADVKNAVDAALTYLASKMTDNGQLTDGRNKPSAETIAQVIVAMTELSIDPAQSEQFTKNGKTLVDGLKGFYLEGDIPGEGSFEHLEGRGYDQMATEQAFYALAAIARMQDTEATSLYDMSDVFTRETKYAITVSAVTNGTVTADKVSAAEGTVITITATPEIGYELTSLEVKTVNGHTIAVTDNQFSMPSAAVTISASFKAVANPADAVEDAISNMSVTNANADTQKALKELQAAYDSLTEEQKAKVDNADQLNALWVKYDELLKAHQDAQTDALNTYVSSLNKNNYTAAKWEEIRNIQKQAQKDMKNAANTDEVNAVYRQAKKDIGNVTFGTEITVYFSLLGDSAHGDNGEIHTLAGGGLTTWIGQTAYKLNAPATVLDVFELALNGYSYTNDGGNYISSINGLAEFTNGAKSGWMYTLNGSHPGLGVAQQEVKDGDVIVFHYTDDYTIEEGSAEFTDQTAANAVKQLINAIGTVTLDKAEAITAARNAYNALTSAEKALVDNYNVLVAAEESFAALKAAADKAAAEQNATGNDKKAAENVEQMIDDIGTVGIDSERHITATRKAYDKLTDIQKALVGNIDVLEAAEATLAQLKSVDTAKDIYKTTGDYMEGLGTPDVGSIGGEWMVIGLARSGREVSEEYYDAAVKYVQENINENGQLHDTKSTDNSRLILALTAIGKDVTDVDGHNLLAGLTDMTYVQKQGINGPIWALIAFDSGNYPIPEGTGNSANDVTRENLIDVILKAQLADGGWALSGTVADSDMTGMALQALAPYYDTNADVKAAVDKAVVLLSAMQNEDGSYSSVDGASSESISQVIVALAALGIDPAADSRFIKDGGSALDALLDYYVEGGGFKHILSGELDGMATEQSYYALTAYFRFLNGENALYDMRDVIDMAAREESADSAETGTSDDGTDSTEATDSTDSAEVLNPDSVGGEDGEAENMWWILILLAGVLIGVLIGAATIFVVYRKRDEVSE